MGSRGASIYLREELRGGGDAAAVPGRALADEPPLGIARDVAQRGADLVERRHVGVAALEVGDEVVLAVEPAGDAVGGGERVAFAGHASVVVDGIADRKST